MEQLKWGLIGTGAIARAFAFGISQTSTGLILAAGSRTQEKAKSFADEFGIETSYGSYEELLADPDIQAVYLSTPHPFHAGWTIKALESGKHVLCEKPLALNHGQAMAAIEAARENNVLLMEAFMYRCHPQTLKLIELIKSDIIGEIRMIQVAFGFGGGDTIDPSGRLFDKKLGGGGILDVGCYPVSMARLVAGIAQDKPFENPVDVSGDGKLGTTGVDEWAAAVMRFENGIIAQVATAIRAPLDNSLNIYGSEGKITVSDPWVADRENAVTGKISISKAEKTEEIVVQADKTSFAYEAELMAKAIAENKKEAIYPAMSPADSLGNLAALDAWRASCGLVYPDETPEANIPARGKLTPRVDAPMLYGSVPGLAKKVSKFIMGCDNQETFSHGAAIWDDWFERGGNAFDTSWVYGGGIMEKHLGSWIKNRGIREDVVVTVKGAHTPRCTPDLLIEDFNESLERLQLDYADIYIMHRDNPAIPVGEFIDVLNDLVNQGKIKGVFGGSNWSLERFREAKTYAVSNKKQEMSILNNNLSLARMVKPVWDGCVHVSDKESRNWIQENEITHFSWSSQARGYFLPEQERMKLGAANFACWDAEDNRARRERAYQMAKQKNCSPLNIAAAYVLNQPFPSFALVGPRAIHETATIMPALEIQLTQDEMDWLWGE